MLVDDWWPEVAPLVRRPGPEPVCSESELITMVLVGACRGWDRETELVDAWRAHRALCPMIPERRRFSRRRRTLMPAINELRRVAPRMLDLARDRQGVIDSLPVPVMHVHLVPSSPATGTWKADGAAFGKVATKKQTIFGYKLHLLVTRKGVILDFVLAPANVNDLEAGAELLAEHRDLLALGDTGYISAPIAAALREQARVELLTLPRRSQAVQVSPPIAALHNRWRQIVETVNGQLAEQLHIQDNPAHTFWGLGTRLYSKLTAHTLGVYLNRLLGSPDCLQLKALAFPN